MSGWSNHWSGDEIPRSPRTDRRHDVEPHWVDLVQRQIDAGFIREPFGEALTIGNQRKRESPQKKICQITFA